MKTAETPKYRLKLVEIALLIGLAVFLVSGGLALRAQEQLSERVVRLHVLANSDGEEDQALKLKVRDRVLARATELLTQAKNRAEAESLLRAALPELEKTAVQEAILRCGLPGNVRGERLTLEDFKNLAEELEKAKK